MTLVTRAGTELHASMIILSEKPANMTFHTDSLNIKEAVELFESEGVLPLQGYEEYAEFNGVRKGPINNLIIMLRIPEQTEEQ